MRTRTLVVLLALGAAATGIVLTSVARQLGGGDASADTSAAAGPQTATLKWRETYGLAGKRLVFSVDWFRVVPGGWKARVGISNRTSMAFDVGSPKATFDRTFGLMLFTSGAHSELDELNRAGTLPTVRQAVRYEPNLPKVLEAGRSWKGTISAPGALAAESWIRVVFGALLVIGKPPAGVPATVVWITDEAHQLRR